MKNDKQEKFCEKDSEKKEQDDSIPFWTALGWTTIPSNSKPKHIENKCPFSQDITYSIIDDSIADFSGSGVLRGKKNFVPDEPDSIDGISYYDNCFGENIASFVDWGSEFYTVRGDMYNPNKWCIEVLISDKITEIGQYAFYGLDAMKRVTVKGKSTIIAYGEIPNNVTICALPNSVAELYAKQNGNPFEELKNPF